MPNGLFVLQDTEGYVLPSWTSDLYPDPFTDYYGEMFLAEYAGTDTMARLLIGNKLTSLFLASEL